MKIFSTEGRGISEDDVPGALAERGVLYFRNGDLGSVRSHVFDWGRPYDHPHQSAPGITLIRARHTRPPAGLSGFTRDRLALHTDRATCAEPPAVVATLVLAAPRAGGQALLADSARVLTAWSRRRRLSTARRSAFLETRKGRTLRPLIDSAPTGGVRIRFRDDGIARPAAMGPAGEEFIGELKRLCSRPVVLDLGPGEGYLIDNYRYLHGRRSFVGERTVVRFLATPGPDHTIPFGFDG
ncbi:Taurine dioxygenase, alpha-ketoglutarate-dependent [Thermomonospora echinospora]|uniref:Taurine dioxygenase, alpha-ketoglutarate-dependent n=1 Tax=Thermomonospora echinospora TaxID=1992 RepID=A0A1H6CB04_9ACTN|nr:TauD/TfdA family dioxygenase [Thermomonospora echinospora]SEG69967.1 Taurine dioxygenase, alpha-ketoglutarate-dependent [Thermomonospora echinospora]